MPVLKNMLVGSATIASTRSFSSSHLRMLEGPDSAAPLKSGEPFMTIPTRPPPSSGARILWARWSRKSICPSEVAGSPGANRPYGPAESRSLVTALAYCFQSTP